MAERPLTVETWDLGDGPPPGAPAPPALRGYEVHEELGRGAMGRVYRALDKKAGRWVALKVSSTAEPERLARFAAEVELQSQLHHPAVPRVLGAGRLGDGRAYIVQTLVRGARTLDLAARGAPWVQRVEWLAVAAEALAVAHGRCVAHGDVKPENLLVDERGRLSLIDWGVSRLAACGAPDPAEPGPAYEALARQDAGWVMGTLAYMPPEQLRGRTEPASDVYALGVVLTELLAGKHPRSALLASPDLLIRDIQAGDLAPKLPAQLPPELHQLATRCLRAAPGLRPESVEAARTLRRVARNERRAQALAARRPPPS
ncbi:MAG: serine/threonine-protein kinase [Planctomycetota bacterium]